MFYLYGADYLVVDILNGGSERLVELSKPYKHEIMGIDMNGFGIVNDFSLIQSFCDESKAVGLRESTIDPFAIPVVVPVIGTAERNSNYHIAMRNALMSHSIRFLVDEIILKQEKSDDIDFLTLEPNALMRRMLGHVQTSLMMEEAVNLEQEVKNGFIKLSEGKRAGLKDRIMATEYGNHLFHLLELKMIKEQQESNIDINDWIIVV